MDRQNQFAFYYIPDGADSHAPRGAPVEDKNDCQAYFKSGTGIASSHGDSNRQHLTSHFLFDLQLFAEEKTEEATPHRLQEVRQKGQVARSNDLSAALVLLASTVFLYWRREAFYQAMADLITATLRDGWHQQLDDGTFLALTGQLALKVGLLLAPLLVLAAVVGLAANFAQTGFVFSLEPLTPRLENLDPIKGLQRFFSRRALMELLKSLAKVTIVSLVVWKVVQGQFTRLLMTVDMGLPATLDLVGQLLYRVGLGALAVFLVLAAADYVFQRREFQRNLRMTKQEIKEEMKQMEGDPLVRSRLREKQRQFARHRMMHAVPEATVVITNPTHVAVALRYRETEGAPRVVAKGAGSIAERIKAVARSHNIPVVENPPVARALYRQVELDQEIPVALYQAVAEILARIYKLRGRL
ncbi:flagellar biosynthesis protein FlhB [Moorella sp. Hama-1]|uniref:flagellar biosynthesis protein FlhB n=1 Tax=Moorella sp. Hama-1 TaxID=2138101 RepID=UPI000D6466FA|nr:flagellar biosynthesis protein FlhB [Moorella sp. Hama-1]BCV20826.1 flagellar biosynthesis protein FlhB [Moorella sp. Hama-1]